MLFVVLMAMAAAHAAASTTAPGSGSSIPVTSAVSLADASLPTLELPDQFGRLRRVQPAVAQRPHLLLLVEVGRLRRIKGFESDLRARVSALEVVRVAHVPAHPPTTLARVAERLRAHVPAEVPVLIDLEGRVAAALQADPGEVNAWVFGPDGQIRRHERGRRDSARIARLTAALASDATAP